MLNRSAIVAEAHVGLRLDLFLARYFSAAEEMAGWSRSAMQKMVAEGQITLNGRKSKASARLKLNDVIAIHWLPPREISLAPEALALDILYEDEDIIVVNKAPGMIVHPAAGRRSGTLVNALLYHCPNLAGIGGERRPGIVHRLDKDTSGVMVVAKHGQAFHHLAMQFKERRVRKEYLAVVWGLVDKKRGIIDRPIGRHRSDRKRMSSLHYLPRVRESATEWQIEDSFRVGSSGGRFAWVTLLRLRPRSGRTHQIRVHLSDQGYPVIGDRIYGRKQASPEKNHQAPAELNHFSRQALHAERLGFAHPRTGREMEFQAPLPPDMRRLLDSLNELRSISEMKKTGKGG